MKLLISDANILIDMEAGDLLPSLFKLPFQIGIPDVLYYEEIAPSDPTGVTGTEYYGSFRGVCSICYRVADKVQYFA